MMSTRCPRILAGLLLCAAPVVIPGVASAQNAPATPGPLIVERIQNSFVAAPDVKVTDVDGQTGTLAGGYAGWVIDRTLLIGGAGYWLTNPSDGTEFGYGGLVVEWTMGPRNAAIRFGAKGLVGVGTATLGADLPFARFGGGRDARGSTVINRRILVRDEFLVAEPQATLRWHLMRHLGLNVGAGYRFTGASRGLDERLNGVTGSLALQIGGW
jgi:hypothetical protein